MKTIEEMWVEYKTRTKDVMEKEGNTFPEELAEKAIKPHFVSGALSILTALAEGPLNDLMQEGSEIAETMNALVK